MRNLAAVRFSLLCLQAVLSINMLAVRNAIIYSPNAVAQHEPFDTQSQDNIYSYFSETNFIVYVSVSIAFLAIEILGVLCDISTFHGFQCLLSTISHTFGIIVILFLQMNALDFPSYKYIAIFCAFIPGSTELFSWIAHFVYATSNKPLR
ncbi:unnamed protein product [Calicophoron daubneyi]|uniref:Transmembrane protein 107 n=1 Tax=Calicophoron daubneyi TaxID=300641 RepID=A0AAV2TDB7_CALDB